MELHVGMMAAGVIQHGEIGDDQGIGAEGHPAINRLFPSCIGTGMGKSVDGNMQFATMLMHIIHRLLQFAVGKVETGKVAGIGVILETDVNRIGPVIHGCFQCRQTACRTE